jgi:hypothetical protein
MVLSSWVRASRSSGASSEWQEENCPRKTQNPRKCRGRLREAPMEAKSVNSANSYDRVGGSFLGTGCSSISSAREHTVETKRAPIVSGVITVESPVACPCCGFLTLRERGGFEICDVCFWEDDGQDDHDADLVRGGPNRGLSLLQARRNFAAYGACDESARAYVRLPRPDEIPCSNSENT